MPRRNCMKAYVLGLLAASSLTHAAYADTTVASGTTLTITATSGPPDNGPITVANGGMLVVDNSSGNFSFANNLNLTGVGLPLAPNQCTSASTCPRYLGALHGLLPATGTVTASGNITVTGETQIRAGSSSADFGANNSFLSPPVGTLLLTGNISGAGNAPAHLTLGNNVVVTGVISDGAGSPLAVTFNGQSLTQANTYSGATSGTVRIVSDSNLGAPGGAIDSAVVEFAGNIASARPFTNSAVVVADAGTFSTLSGSFLATGAHIDIRGPGTVTLTGAAAAPIFLDAGTNGGTLVIANPAFFARGDTQVTVEGTLQTSTPIPIIKLASFNQLGGSTLQLHQLSATQSESLAVSGSAALNGTLQIFPFVGQTGGGQFVVVNAASLSGRYSSIVGPRGDFIRATYTSTSLTVQELALSDLATDSNGAAAGQAVARGMTAGLAGSLFATPGVFFGLSPTDPSFGHYLDELTPQRFQVFRGMAFDRTGFMASTVDAWSGLLPDERGGSWKAFGSGTGTVATITRTAGTASASYDGAGVIAGLAHVVGDGASAGVLLGYESADARLDREGSDATVKTVTPALFAVYRDGGFTLRGLASYGFTNYTTLRQVQIASTLNQAAQGTTTGHTPGASLGASYDLTQGDVQFGPTADATYTHLHIDGFTERNAATGGLIVGAQNADSLRSRLGGHLGTNAGGIHIDLNLAWQHEYLAGVGVITSDFVQGATGGFATNLASLKGDALFGAVHGSIDLGGNVTGFLGYQVQANAAETAHNFMGGIKVAF